MDWRAYIVSDPETLGGKPIVRGTRLGVEFILGLLADGWSPEQLLASYPALTAESLRAVYAFAAEVTRDEALFDLRPGAA